MQVGEKLVINDRTFVTHRAPILYNSEIWGAVGVFHDVSALESITGELESHTKDRERIRRIKERTRTHHRII